MPTVLCKNPLCQQPFHVSPSTLQNGSGLHCCRACRTVTDRLFCDQRTTKKCSVCHEEKPIEDFYVQQSGRKVGLPTAQCKPCNKAAVYIFREENPEAMAAIRRRHFLNHPEDVHADAKRQRARKANAPVNDFTAAQWLEMQIAYQHSCVYCGKRAKGQLTQDHITPLAKGGSHTASNIVPACINCNRKKHTGPVPRAVQPLLLTVSPSKPKNSRL